MGAFKFSPGHCGTGPCGCVDCLSCPVCNICPPLTTITCSYTNTFWGTGSVPLVSADVTPCLFFSGCVNNEVIFELDFDGAAGALRLMVTSFLAGCSTINGGCDSSVAGKWNLVSFTCSPFFAHFTVGATCTGGGTASVRRYTDLVFTA